MKYKILPVRLRRMLAVAVVAICILVPNAPAQRYRGAPVKKERLLKALRSKLLQTRDIVAVINSNGVDFALTDEVRRELVSAGARPEVVSAVARNLRAIIDDSSSTVAAAVPNDTVIELPNRIPEPPNYDELVERAMQAYREENDAPTAVKLLKAATEIEPRKPEAYQMLGFVSLYGANDAKGAESLMREAFNSGGSAVFRVYHEDDTDFAKRCSGSLYISSGTVRYESDDNRHTFEFSIATIDKIRISDETNLAMKPMPVLKMNLRIGRQKATFRFTPVTGRGVEASMAERFVYVARNGLNFMAWTGRKDF